MNSSVSLFKTNGGPLQLQIQPQPRQPQRGSFGQKGLFEKMTDGLRLQEGGRVRAERLDDSSYRGSVRKFTVMPVESLGGDPRTYAPLKRGGKVVSRRPTDKVRKNKRKNPTKRKGRAQFSLSSAQHVLRTNPLSGAFGSSTAMQELRSNTVQGLYQTGFLPLSYVTPVIRETIIQQSVPRTSEGQLAPPTQQPPSVTLPTLYKDPVPPPTINRSAGAMLKDEIENKAPEEKAGGMFKCEFCDKFFPTQRGLSGHVTKIHNSIGKPSMKSEGRPKDKRGNTFLDELKSAVKTPNLKPRGSSLTNLPSPKAPRQKSQQELLIEELKRKSRKK